MKALTRSLPVALLFLGIACSDDPADRDPVEVASVTVVPDTATVHEGAQIQLAAVVRDESQNELTGRTVTWTSEDEAVATASSAGLVTGVTGGDCRATISTPTSAPRR